ncbi:hypothetical protein FACS1894184_08750 [Clostridia bacterium]|nr:hypothetical protein FACS1894184_08750 [Clostridia bacterium]
MSYNKYKLSCIATIKTGKLDSNASVINGAYPFFTCSPETFTTNTFSFDTEAVLLAGNNANGNYTAKYYCGKFDVYQRTYVIESKDNKILDARYLYYALNMKLAELKSVSAGSTTKFLTKVILDNLLIVCPSLLAQHRIASILSAYDDLIENNRRQIKLLEEAAMRLYREWFVYLRFPGYEGVKVVDGVPEGWEWKQISDMGQVITGKTPPTDDSSYYGNLIPFIKIPDMHNNVYPIMTETKLSLEGAEYQKNKMIPPGSIIVSCIATVGLTCMTHELCQTNQQINAVIPFNRENLYYLYLHTCGIKTMLQGLGSNGATMTNVNKTKLANISILLPSKHLILQFNVIVSPCFRSILTLTRKIVKLQQSRDLLLPKLMRGEIDVGA